MQQAAWDCKHSKMNGSFSCFLIILFYFFTFCCFFLCSFLTVGSLLSKIVCNEMLIYFLTILHYFYTYEWCRFNNSTGPCRVHVYVCVCVCTRESGRKEMLNSSSRENDTHRHCLWTTGLEIRALLDNHHDATHKTPKYHCNFIAFFLTFKFSHCV